MDTVDDATRQVEDSASWVERTWSDLVGLFTGIDGPLELLIAVVIAVVVIGGIIAAVASFAG